MPLAAGLVGIIPALGLLTPEEHPGGPVTFTPWQLLAWCSALAFFGVFVAVPLRYQTIIREKLRFPSGTATASVIRTLHGLPQQQSKDGEESERGDRLTGSSLSSSAAAVAAANGLAKQRQSDEGGLLQEGAGRHTQQQGGRTVLAGQQDGNSSSSSSSGSSGSNNMGSSQVDLEVAVWAVSASRQANTQSHSAYDTSFINKSSISMNQTMCVCRHCKTPNGTHCPARCSWHNHKVSAIWFHHQSHTLQ
jgi:hypothetical protein